MAEQIGGMVYSPQHRFVYVHVPKTAGGSLKRALLAQCPDARSPAREMQAMQHAIVPGPGSAVKNRLMPWLQKTPLRYVVTTAGHPSMALTLLGNPSFLRYRKFAFVRNPYDRLVSRFEFARQYQDYPDDFGTFAGHCLRHLQPQVNFLYFRRHRLVDWLGHYERLDEDVDALARWLALPRLSLIRRNVTQRARFEDYYSVSLKRRIGELYQDDFAMFGYPP